MDSPVVVPRRTDERPGSAGLMAWLSEVGPVRVSPRSGLYPDESSSVSRAGV